MLTPAILFETLQKTYKKCFLWYSPDFLSNASFIGCFFVFVLFCTTQSRRDLRSINREQKEIKSSSNVIFKKKLNVGKCGCFFFFVSGTKRDDRERE